MKPASKPEIELDEAIVDALRAVCDVRPADVLAKVHAGLKPCFALHARRTSDLPLRREGLGAWLGRPTAEANLPTLRSKFGGSPYDEGASWSGYSFVAQINFEDFDGASVGMPERGILALDAGPEFRLRWYPAPSKSKAVAAHPACVGRYECAIDFQPSWSLPGNDAEFLALFDGFPQAALDVLVEWLPSEQLGWHEGTHQLGGWREAGLIDHYGFQPPAGTSTDLGEWTMILRLDFDNEADFAWGSNVIYVIAPNADVARGDLARAVVVAANF